MVRLRQQPLPCLWWVAAQVCLNLHSFQSAQHMCVSRDSQRFEQSLYTEFWICPIWLPPFWYSLSGNYAYLVSVPWFLSTGKWQTFSQDFSHFSLCHNCVWPQWSLRENWSSEDYCLQFCFPLKSVCFCQLNSLELVGGWTFNFVQSF